MSQTSSKPMRRVGTPRRKPVHHLHFEHEDGAPSPIGGWDTEGELVSEIVYTECLFVFCRACPHRVFSSEFVPYYYYVLQREVGASPLPSLLRSATAVQMTQGDGGGGKEEEQELELEERTCLRSGCRSVCSVA